MLELNACIRIAYRKADDKYVRVYLPCWKYQRSRIFIIRKSSIITCIISEFKIEGVPVHSIPALARIQSAWRFKDLVETVYMYNDIWAPLFPKILYWWLCNTHPTHFYQIISAMGLITSLGTEAGWQVGAENFSGEERVFNLLEANFDSNLRISYFSFRKRCVWDWGKCTICWLLVSNIKTCWQVGKTRLMKEWAECNCSMFTKRRSNQQQTGF